MKRILKTIFSSLLLLLLFLTFSKVTYAADIRSNDNIEISQDEKNLEDLYLFGGTIRVDAPVTNDVVAAGGNITFNSDVTGSIMAAGGNINLKGSVGNTARVAGGNIVIDGKITRDLVVAGGSITVSKTASVGGDLVVSGENITLEGPVQGKVLVNGGEVRINNTINKDVQANVGKLTLLPNARINGNLSYSSSDKAIIDPQAVVRGDTKFNKVEREQKNVAGILGLSALYKLVTDIILSVLFILFLARFIQAIIVRMMREPLKAGAIGFAYLILFPLASLIFLVLIWLGVASFLFYALTLVITTFLSKVFVGWWLLRWYEARERRQYVLDWRAGVVGPIVLFILLLIPIIGWLAAALLYLVALGALTTELTSLVSTQRLSRPAVVRSGRKR